MRRTIAIWAALLVSVAAPRAGWAAEPSVTFANTNATRHWIRREAQLARIAPDQLAKFQKHASTSVPSIRPVLEKHGLENQNLFTIELEPGAFVALRYYEYVGADFTEDMQRLEQNGRYKEWKHVLDACLADGWADLECVFYTGGQQQSRVADDRVKRIGRVVGLRPEMVEPYVLLHAHTWPGVLAAIREGNIRNYSIFLARVDSKLYLFAYLEYVGADFEADMARIGADPHTRAWIKFTDDGCQLPISTRKPGEWWASMERL